MPQYRFFSSDILTGAVLAELPLYGISLDRRLSGVGNFTGTFRVGTGLHLDEDLLEGTKPGKCCVYVERDGTVIWGGPIWSRTYASNGKTISLTAQTWESVFDRIVILEDFVKEGVEQLQIFKDLIDALQAQPNSNLGFDTSMINAVPSGVLRTVLVPGYEYHFAQTIISDLVSSDNAFDYTIDLLPSGIQDHPNRFVRVGYPQLGSSNSGLEFDYPGNILRYWWRESGGGTRFTVLGAGTGPATITAVTEASDLLAEGYPSWWIVKKYPSIGTTEDSSSKAAGDAIQFRMPLSNPTFELKPDRIPPYDAWSQLGDSFTVHIEDPRFPNGKDIVRRHIGWSLQIADADATEILKFEIQATEGDASA